MVGGNMPKGRPSSYTEELAELFLDAVERTGSIRQATIDVGVSRSTISRWAEERSDFDAAIARAKKDGYAERAERAVEEAKMAEDAGLGRLAFDAERWYLSKIDPARYGDKLDLTSAGDKLPTSDPADVAARAAALMEIARRRKEGE
jgi:hypothetical protein